MCIFIFVNLGYSELNQISPTPNPEKLTIVGPFSAPSLSSKEWESWNDKLGVPYFVPNQTHTVLAPLGHTTYLHCIVGNLGDRQVNKFTIFLSQVTIQLHIIVS